MKKIILLLGICLNLLANDILVFSNEYQVLELHKKVKKLIVGNRDIINVSLLGAQNRTNTKLKIFGKKNGNTSILIIYRDSSIENYHVYVNENLGFVQKMINVIEPSIRLSKVGDGATVMAGTFKNPHNKQRILDILENSGVNLHQLMDLTKTKKVNKMIRTKLYLVEINNKKAKDLGGVTGLGFFNKYLKMAINPEALNAATFSGFLLDNTAKFTAATGNSVVGTLNFLEEKGIANILDDTVLITTEDKNATFRVGGEVYIPVGLTQNVGYAPTIQVEERKYGLRLTLTTHFLEIKNYMNLNVRIKDSEFDTNKEHDVQLGDNIFVPSFISKNIQTHVVAKSGQVIALGGRLHSEDADRKEKVPFLGDIPLIGELFKHTVSGTKTNDLIFFLVPEIVDANENLDDTHYYKEFKDTSDIFHKAILETQKEKTEAETNTSTSTVNETIIAPLIEHEKETTSNEIIIVDDNSSIALQAQPTQSPKTSMPDSNTTQEAATLTSSEAIEPTVIKKEASVKLETSSKPQATVESQAASAELQAPITLQAPVKTKTAAQKNMFAVSAHKVFLRDKPVDGKVVNVWIMGHKFTVADEVIKSGNIWLKVDENCRKECKKVSKDYWISKRFVSQL